MYDWVVRPGRIKGPTIAPSHVKNPLGAIKVGAKTVLLDRVLGKLPVFPGCRKTLKFKYCYLGIRRVGCLFLLIQYWRAFDRSATGGKDAFRIFFLSPP